MMLSLPCCLLFASSSSPPPWITVVFAIILAALITSLALEEKLHAKKSVIAGIFAVVCLLLAGIWGLLPFEPATNPAA